MRIEDRTRQTKMKKIEIEQNGCLSNADDTNQKGSAIVIALFVLALISVFVALALSRNSAEAAAVGNETADGRTFYAAQGSLETMTRNFNKVFEVKINPSTTDLDAVRNGSVANLGGPIPGPSPYVFNQELDLTTPPGVPNVVVLPGGPYAGLYAFRDNWRLRTTATNIGGVQVQLTRNILNNRIPIFQFGIFYNDDLELFRPPRFSFGGRVHSNGNFFVSPGTEGVYFDSRVTAVGQIVTKSWRNWNQSDSANDQTFIKNGSGAFVQLLPDRGSVLNTTAGAADNIFEFPPAIPLPMPTPNADLPPSRLNASWGTQSAIFDGNLQAQVPALKLPLSVGSATDLIEIVRRGQKTASAAGGDLFNNAGTLAPVTVPDNDILRAERFSNKTGIRVSLSDSQAKLPGCASGVGLTPVTLIAPARCGVRLDGDINGRGTDPILLPQPTPSLPLVARGYQPKSMTDGYLATRVNGERLYNGNAPGAPQVWIKIETVRTDTVTGAILTTDITEDILSLGVTEEVPSSITITSPSTYTGSHSNNGTPTSPSANITATAAQTVSTFPDSRSVVKLQTFTIPGPAIPPVGATLFVSPFGAGATATNVVRRYTGATGANFAGGCASGCTGDNADPNASLENYAHLKQATVNGISNAAIVPFPIEMFDAREGEYYDDITRYTAGKVTRNGVMSMIDIDVANLRRFLRGDFNGLFPTNTPFALANGNVGLVNTNIPDLGGWVFYVSDRRGDSDFDGKYAMEDIYGAAPGNNGVLDPGEDLEPVGAFGNGTLNAKYYSNNSFTSCIVVPLCEAPKYADESAPDRAAVTDHPYYRRGVRLINGTTVPGIYDAVTAANTKGFTIASENGVYVRGNYNATGAANPPASGNTPYNQYTPLNTPTHIPASIASDSVTILSNGWNDAQSFSSPYNQAARVSSLTTQMRFGMISGDTIATKDVGVNQGGISPHLNGGVHNFKRFLEKWTGNRLDYSGSLINLFNSRNNNGSFKCCNTVYNPPIRNWVFDSTFLDPARLPPGTPFFQYVQTTGFQRTNN